MTIIKVPTPTYFGMWYQFSSAPFKLHNFLFCANDTNHCMEAPSIDMWWVDQLYPKFWPMQKGTNLKQDEVIFLEEIGFVINV